MRTIGLLTQLCNGKFCLHTKQTSHSPPSLKYIYEVWCIYMYVYQRKQNDIMQLFMGLNKNKMNIQLIMLILHNSLQDTVIKDDDKLNIQNTHIINDLRQAIKKYIFISS